MENPNFHCRMCGEIIDSQIYANWLRSERIIKLEMGLRPSKETREMEEEASGMKRCIICKIEKPKDSFPPRGKIRSRICLDCTTKKSNLPQSSQPQSDLTNDFGKMFAAIKKEGERDGMKKVAQDIIDFLTTKYMGA
jgi:hypothetical protein